MTLTWITPNPSAPHYWEAQSGGFWIALRAYYNPETDTSTTRYVLLNGEHELGVFDSLLEAQHNAEPRWCDDELLEDTECFWCLGHHPDGEVCRFAPYYIEQRKGDDHR